MKHRKKTVSALLALLLALTCLLSACSGNSALEGTVANGMYAGAMDAVMPEGIPGESNTESYTEIKENAFVSTAENNTSYFSIDANTAAYPNLRSLIQNGYDIPKDAVRVEEMLNYFHYDYAKPEDGTVLALSASLFDTPYNPETKLLTIGLAAQEVEFTETKNNLVFLIDTSGSMFSADKLELVQSAFMMLAENLNPEDRVSIVTYAGTQTVALSGAYGYEKQKIMAVIEDLQARGSTAGSKGIETAYQLAKQYFIEGGNNRVILATDGDFNVGISNTDELKEFISGKRETGIFFSVFGVGRGNLKSDKMEALALSGNGTYSYIDSQKEARRALVEQIGGSMITVAKDVKAGVIFDPAYVESFRLVGYENKLLTQEEFENSTTDAGELGSGHTVTVVYEIKLTQAALTADAILAQVDIRYKAPDAPAESESQQLLMDITGSAYHGGAMTAQDAFIASVVEFALLLRDSEYKADATYDGLLTLLEGLDLSGDEFKTEFRELVRSYTDKLK